MEREKRDHATDKADTGHAATMARIKSGMDRLGDLPIFSTSINKIRRVSSDPQSDAMAVAQEVLKDANLCAKLLRLGNSAYYNRGVGKISVVSRAVVLLGFETVKNLTLTLKLIESFQNTHPSIDMTQMLVRAYLAGGLVRQVASKCGVKDIEESYVCALLHNLGEIITAYVLPADFIRILDLIKQKGMEQHAAEFAVMGTTCDAIGQELATTWEFSPLVVSCMSRAAPQLAGPLRDRAQLNRALARLGNHLATALYVDRPQRPDDFAETLQHIATVTGLELSRVELGLTESFRMSCALAQEYGLHLKHLQPLLGDGEENVRNKWARQLAYFAAVETGGAPPPIKPRSSEVAAPADPAVGTVPSAAPAIDNSHRQLALIQEITQLIASGARLNQIFVKVLQGILEGADFDRALLCLVTPDRRSYVARLAVGRDHEGLKAFFNLPLRRDVDIFSKLLLDGGELLISDGTYAAWDKSLPQGFAEAAATRDLIAAALQFDGKPVGLIYADRALSKRAIGTDDLRNMINFVTQARLALRLCS